MDNNFDEVPVEKNKPFFPVSAESKSSVLIFIISIVLVIALTFSMWAIKLATIYALRMSLTLIVITVYTAVAVVAMKLTGQQRKLVPTKRRLWLQILIGIAIAALLCLVMAVIPILCGQSIGSHTEMSAGQLVIVAVEDLIFVGIGEEVLFRGYIQNQFEIWLKKHKWLAPLIAAAIFGLWHIINGSLLQVLLTTLIGCVIGYSKYFIKDCTLLSVIIAHGLYDFSLVLITCFIL